LVENYLTGINKAYLLPTHSKGSLARDIIDIFERVIAIWEERDE
jgi:hypothetical protein